MEKKNKGFTLAELLVVVAIIGALVAIALPMFLKQKAEANLKTDQTFVKSAKATAISEYLGGDEDDDNGTGVDYIYDAGLSIAWKIDNTLNLSTIKGYGRSTQDPYKTKTGVTDESTPVSADGNPNYLQVHVTTNGKVTGACWVKPGEKTVCGEGGTVTPDPTPTPGTPEATTDPDACDELVATTTFKDCLSRANITDLNDENVQCILGNIYRYKNELYVCTTPVEYGIYMKPDGNARAQFRKINSESPTLLMNCDATFRWNEYDNEPKFESLNEGDIYYNDNKFYVVLGQFKNYPIPKPEEIRNDSNPNGHFGVEINF